VSCKTNLVPQLYDLPKQGRSDEGIARIIDQVVPNSSFARTVVARNVKDLPSLISQHESAVRKLEKVLAKYLKNPDKLPPGRPTCKPSRKDPSYDTYPRGQNIDAIEYYTSRIRQLEVEIKQVRSTVDKRGTMPYGFASYADIAEAHNIAYACRNKKPHGATVVLAPRPNDVIWANMPLSKAARNRKRWISSFWIVLLTFLWIAPNAMIAIFLVNLSNLGKFWPGFQRSLEANTQVWGAVQGILSPAIMSLVYLVLPMIFRRLQIKAGDMTKTGRERHVLGKLFAFFFFNNLFVFSVFSVIWTFVANIVQDTEDGQDAWQSILKNNFFALLFVSLCKNSPFWVTYLLQRQLGAAVDIAQLYCLVEAFFLKKLGSPTPRKLIELTAPPPFEYASYYNYFLFYAAVTLCFAPVQPLVLPATALYFIIDYYLKKYLLLYRFVTKTESGGLFWRVLFNRFIFATIFSHLIVLLTTWVRGEGTHIQFYACCPLPILMLAFKFYCHKAFDNKIRFYSTRNVSKHPEATLQKEDRQRSERLASRFGHPALYKKLITPMVSQKAQNLLPSIYTGRLTDGRDGGADDMMSVSGYSDMYALNNMQGGKPGKAANNVPGFEYVAESQMDFEHYKNREEFAEDHGGGEIYGRQGEIMRPNTPGSVGDWSDNGSRPDSPFSNNRMQYGPGSSKRSETGFAAYRPSPALGRNHNPMSDNDLARTQSPLYTHDNGSGSALVRNAAASPMSPPEPYHDAPVDYGHSRASSGGRATPSRSRSPGPAHGLMGPHGYSGLAQSEHASPREDDSTQYDYFRGGSRPSRRGPGQGW
jgi:calcium permeable stress-gated cation channel